MMPSFWKRSPALVLAGLLALAGVIILLTVGASLRELGRQERLLATRVVMESVAATLERARQYGVPLPEVIGLDELVDARLPSNLGVAGIRLVSQEGKVLWQRGYTPSIGDTGQSLTIPVGVSGAILLVSIDDGAHRPAMLRLAFVLLLVAAALAIPELELARYVDLLRHRYAKRVLTYQTQALSEGDFRYTWRTVASNDPRLKYLRDQVYLLNERHQRVSRLLNSLQRTEPDTNKRTELASLMPALSSHYRFSENGLPIERTLWPAAGSARHFGQFALLLLNLGLWLIPAGVLPSTQLLAGFTAFGLGALLASQWSPRHWTHILLSTLGIATVANIFISQNVAWMALTARLLSGIGTTWVIRAVMQAQRDPMDFPMEMPAIATTTPNTNHAHWSGLLLAGFFAGPVLGLALSEALGPEWLWLGALLPALGALAFFLLLPNATKAPTVQLAEDAQGNPLVAFTAGSAWTAAAVLMLVLQPGIQSAWLDNSILQLIVSAPLPLLLLLQRHRNYSLPASGLLLIVAALPYFPASIPQLPVAAAGAAMIGAAFFLPLPARGKLRLDGLALGLVLTSGMLLLCNVLMPSWTGPAGLTLLTLLLSVGLFTRRVQ